MFKDMSFLDGTQRLTQIASDIASTDEKRLEAVGEGLIKSYLGFLSRPLPQNNKAVQQIWKFFDPVSYPQNSIKNMLMYAGGVQHFLKYPKVDQLGDVVKSYPGETLLPYTHWLNIQGMDERWKFLSKYNAIPNKLYNRTMQLETESGIEKRKLEEDEFYDYTSRTGQLFSQSLVNYMQDKEKVNERAKAIIEREKANGDTEKVNGIREDMEKLWSKASDNAEVELFRWGSVKETMPETWELIKKHSAYQIYQTSKSTEGYNWSKSELYEFNNLATIQYAERVKGYLQSENALADKKRDSDKDGISNFQERIDKIWSDVKSQVGARMEGQIRKKIRASKK